MTDADIVAMVRERGGLCLGRALADMGLIVETHRAAGSTASVVEALEANGLQRPLKVFAALATEDALRDAALSLNGNFAVQRLLEAAARLRPALATGGVRVKAAALQVAAFRKDHGGRDPFAALLRAMLPSMLELCTHDKGVFVAQCAVEHAANAELLALAQSIFPLAVPVSAWRDDWGG